jgi:diadenosine tetraphosphate (Ap4A) HIT family hydrolase
MAGWQQRDRWLAMKSSEACPICADIHLDVNEFSFKVAELERSWLRFNRNESAAGWCIVFLKRHANELWELDADELAGFWRDVARAAKVVNRVYQPAKMNYAVYGNLCPHVHCHLIPQPYTADPTRALDAMSAPEVRLTDEEYAATVAALRRALDADT